jgi:hypothetical protein
MPQEKVSRIEYWRSLPAPAPAPFSTGSRGRAPNVLASAAVAMAPPSRALSRPAPGLPCLVHPASAAGRRRTVGLGGNGIYSTSPLTVRRRPPPLAVRPLFGRGLWGGGGGASPPPPSCGPPAAAAAACAPAAAARAGACRSSEPAAGDSTATATASASASASASAAPLRLRVFYAGSARGPCAGSPAAVPPRAQRRRPPPPLPPAPPPAPPPPPPRRVRLKLRCRSVRRRPARLEARPPPPPPPAPPSPPHAQARAEAVSPPPPAPQHPHDSAGSCGDEQGSFPGRAAGAGPVVTGARARGTASGWARARGEPGSGAEPRRRCRAPRCRRCPRAPPLPPTSLPPAVRLRR